jgi:hypothetical protein
MCVVNTGGQALAWAMNREDNDDFPAFLDRGLERFRKNPDGQEAVATERYVHYPRERLANYQTKAAASPISHGHAGGGGCPSWTSQPSGTVVARVVGRALSKDGKPVTETARQGNYIEDRFHITVRMQEKLARALADAKADRVPLPLELTRDWVKHCYLGVLDVQPLDNPGRGRGELKHCDFRAQRVGTGKGLTLWRVEGESEVSIGDKMIHGSPGDMHEIKLKWRGFIELDENRMTRLVVSARGPEKLKFVSLFNMACNVRFGILGEPVAHRKAADGK